MALLPTLPDHFSHDDYRREQLVVTAWVKRHLLPRPYRIPTRRPRKTTVISSYETFSIGLSERDLIGQREPQSYLLY